MQTLIITPGVNSVACQNGARSTRDYSLTKFRPASVSGHQVASQIRSDVQVSYVFHGDPPRVQYGLLAEDVREFAHIRHEGVRTRSLVTRHQLRRMLSECAGFSRSPESWVFGRDGKGKPYVKNGHGLEFNCSHSAKVSIIAVSRHHKVGIDIETTDISVDPEFLAAFYAPRERLLIRTLPASDRGQALSRLWTLKEAYAKVLGIGLALDLTGVDFASEARFREPSLSVHGTGISLSGWTFDLNDKSFSVALAVQAA